MPCRGSCRPVAWLLMGALLTGHVSAAGPDVVRKGERYYVSIPMAYSVYKADAKTCDLPLDKVRCERAGEDAADLTICAYSQGACERAYLADTVSEEKVVLFPSEAKCGGFTLSGEWPAVVFSSVEECRKAAPLSRALVLERVSGYYGSKIIVKRKNR
jgi:hypothetical protein